MRTTNQISDAVAKRTLATSCAIILAVGATAICTHWLHRGHPALAILTTTTFVTAMIALHVTGFRLYQRQPITWSPAYRPALHLGIWVMLVTAVFASTIMMRGIDELFAICAISYWAGAGIIICRRPESPRHSDLQFIRWGLPWLFGIMLVLIPLVAA
jgi:hypothetical protein